MGFQGRRCSPKATRSTAGRGSGKTVPQTLAPDGSPGLFKTARPGFAVGRSIHARFALASAGRRASVARLEGQITPVGNPSELASAIMIATQKVSSPTSTPVLTFERCLFSSDCMSV